MAKSNFDAPTTQRAYTLRLRGTDANDHSWRDALWATHEAVNKGAKAFGDWLLTLRGGLCHTLADARVPQPNKDGKEQPDRDPTSEERRDRCILLALSWLSVESAPKDGDMHKPFVIASGQDSKASRDEKVVRALREILEKRGVKGADLSDWIADCEPSLSAAIRDDAVWVNRSAAFDAVTAGWDIGKARWDTHTLLSFILKDDFLTLPTPKKTGKKTEGDRADETDQQAERQAAIKASSKGAGQRTRHPFSHLLGEGRPFGKPQRSLSLRDKWHDDLKPKIGASGIPVVPVRKKVKKGEDRKGPAHTELQREMFSKAASRVAQIVTKQRQQEADRLARKSADEALKAMEGQNIAYRNALDALNRYCADYGLESGATEEFRLRPRQITGWDRVVAKWASVQLDEPDQARKARIEAVKEVQESDEDKKFGDANLFFRLADQEYVETWLHDGNVDHTILSRFVAGMKARSDAQRLKVASYRHPDPYLNPIFCQFGVSRPKIEFRRIKAFTDEPEGGDPRAVGMLLWHPNEKSAKLTLMRGVSRRLDEEIGSSCDAVRKDAHSLPPVSRRSRLGAAAAGLPSADAPSRVAGVFDLKPVESRAADDADAGEEQTDGGRTGKLKEPKWNGTLSANRRELAAIRRLLDKRDEPKAQRRRDQLRWTLIVSLEMEARGPWHRYVTEARDNTPFLYTVRKDEDKGLKRKKGTTDLDLVGWPWDELNKPLIERQKAGEPPSLVVDAKSSRGNKACFILSRLPGLRMLSVDLGHRYAAACAVWETLTIEQMNAACRAANHALPKDSDLFIHLLRPTEKIHGHGRKKGQKIDEKVVYRRIGADKLPDGKDHPAPWARLDRQFLIKLQGEEVPARAVWKEIEQVLVDELAKRLGLIAEDERHKGRGVDELMSRAVSIAKLGLARHARRAKIAYKLDPNTKSIPGMGGKETAFTPGDEDHIKFLTNALFDWHALAGEHKWNDEPARKLWNEHIAVLEKDKDWHMREPAKPDTDAQQPTRQQRRKDLCERLKPLAERLAKADRAEMHKAWKERWEKDDGLPAKVDKSTGKKTADGSGWHADLRRLTDWIMGKRLRGATGHGWKQNVGGLSITRIATMKSLYQLHKRFAMRPWPNKPCGAPEKGESNAGVAQSILNAMERMREQRVKQLASRIAEAALGIGRVKPADGQRDRQRPRQRVDDPCHAVVIENLTNYRPEETHTRRENRKLMSWSASKVKKYLSEACQLHGLHLREVQAGYTSRQDSRTGSPGVRCADVPVGEFLTAPWWRRQVNIAKEKVKHGKGDARDRYLAALDAQRKAAQSLRIPVNGGELFVSADPRSPATKGLQADLNAAANIGLKALLDPDWPGKWWYVPCSTKDGKPSPDKVKGAACIDPARLLCDPPSESTKKASGKRPKEIINVWRDPAASMDGSWQHTAAYWQTVRSRVIDLLRAANGLTKQVEKTIEPTETPW